MADWFTRALTTIAPAWAVRREAARRAIEAMRAYDGAGTGRRMKNWRAPNTSANTETAPALAQLRNRSRDLCRNNPYAARAVDILVAHQVGYGIQARPKTGARQLDQRLKTLWTEWAKSPDVEGRLDFAGMQALVARTRAESGEALIRIFAGGNGRVPLRLQVLEPDHLDTNKTEVRPNGNRVVNGVELDAAGRRVGYWLFDDHPGDYLATARFRRESSFVSAESIIHVFAQQRPGQQRGVPDLAPVMTRLRMLDDYQEAELERARTQACLAAFITTPSLGASSPLAGAVDEATGQRRKTLAPGMMEQLLPGEDVKFLAPAGSSTYPDHVRVVLHAIAVGFGVTYHQLTGDLRDANYSSLRAGNIEFRRRVEQAQWLMLIPQFLQRVWDEFIRFAILSGAIPERGTGYAVEWVPPTFEAVDPLKDAQAIRERLSLRLTTPQKEIGAQGYTPEEIVTEWTEWAASLNAAGLPELALEPAPPEPQPAPA